MAAASDADPNVSPTLCHRRPHRVVTDRPPNQEIVNPDEAPAVAIVTQWYDLIDRGRTGEACRLFRDDIEWFEPEGSPYGAPGSALVGAAAIVSEG